MAGSPAQVAGCDHERYQALQNSHSKSVYDADSVYFLVQYPDINKDVIRSAWAYNAAKIGLGNALETMWGRGTSLGFSGM